MALTKGLKPKDRKLAVKSAGKLTGNQWQSTPQQQKFMANWLNVSSSTFGNAYRSALEAGYSDHYAKQITAVAPQWLTDFKGLSKLQLEHIEQKLISMITGNLTRDDSNSPADTVLKAIEMYGKFTGQLTDKATTTNILVQPILSGESVPKAQRVVIDQ